MAKSTEFSPGSVELVGGFRLSSPPHEVFELFSPLGEKLWAPGWDPELIYPPDVAWERGQIFRTREERGEAVWVVTELDREQFEVEYHRVEAGRYVVKVRVQCRDLAEHPTDVRVTYTFIGLSDAGNRDIAAMTTQSHEETMGQWQELINRYLSGTTS